MQLPDVVDRPGLVVVVVVWDHGEAAGSLLRRHPAVWQILHRTCAPDPVLRDPDRNAGRLKVLTLQNLHIDQVRGLKQVKWLVNNTTSWNLNQVSLTEVPVSSCGHSPRVLSLSLWGHVASFRLETASWDHDIRASSQLQKDKCVYVSHLVFGVQNHGLCVRHSDHVVVKGGGGQPHSSRQLVVEQRQLGDQTLGLLLFGRQRRQTFPDPH